MFAKQMHRFIALALCALPALSFAEGKPNVVIFYTDDQGTLDARCYGSDHLITPNLDKLAATGIRFTQAYAHSFCCPSRAALLTGRHPQRGGVNEWVQGDMRATEKGVNMALSEVTLAEAMKAGGYRTALFGKWHLGSHPDHGPTRQGFDEFFGIRGGFIDNNTHFFLQGDGFHDLYEGTREIWAKGRYFPQMVVDRANRFIEENQKRPFFIYLALNTPHYPEQPPKEHLAKFDHLKEPRRTYSAFIHTTDDLIGQVMSKLNALGLREDTVLIFMSDNGHQSYQSYDFFQVKIDNHRSGYPKGHRFSVGDSPSNGGGNTGKWTGHKGTFFEGGIRVPAIISYTAKLPQGQVRDQVVTAMDWYPTLLELCDLKAPEVQFDGRSLLPVIRSAKAPSPHPVLYLRWQNNWAFRQGDWKLIRKKGRWEGARERFWLYSLAGNQPETHDYAKEKPEVLKRMIKLQAEWSQKAFSK